MPWPSKLTCQCSVYNGRDVLLLNVIDIKDTSEVVLDCRGSLLHYILALFMQTHNFNQVIDQSPIGMYGYRL